MTTYCINLDTSATSEFSNYAFNSYCAAHDGHRYALTSAGLFLLEGDTDDGEEIEASIQTGKQDFKTQSEKRLNTVYVGASSPEKMALTINSMGVEHDYNTRSYSEELNQQRFDVGKGLRANWFDFTVRNTSGADFEVADFSVDGLQTNRII